MQARKIIKRGKNELNLLIHADNSAAVLSLPLKTMTTMAIIMMMMKLSAIRYSPSASNFDVKSEKNEEGGRKEMCMRVCLSPYICRG